MIEWICKQFNCRYLPSMERMNNSEVTELFNKINKITKEIKGIKSNVDILVNK